MSTTDAVSVILVENESELAEAMAVAGFLAGYCGATRRSYASDLRLFSSWCHEAKLSIFTARRAHLELFGRWMEETGRMRSTVARRLSTLASFYRYCEQEGLRRAQSRRQRPPTQTRLRVPDARPRPQRARGLPRPGWPRLSP